MRALHEQRPDMALVKILYDVSCNDTVALIKRIQVTLPHPGGNFVADMQQLPEVGIVALALPAVPQGGNKFFGTPALDRLN